MIHYQASSDFLSTQQPLSAPRCPGSEYRTIPRHKILRVQRIGQSSLLAHNVVWLSHCDRALLASLEPYVSIADQLFKVCVWSGPSGVIGMGEHQIQQLSDGLIGSRGDEKIVVASEKIQKIIPFEANRVEFTLSVQRRFASGNNPIILPAQELTTRVRRLISDGLLEMGKSYFLGFPWGELILTIKDLQAELGTSSSQFGKASATTELEFSVDSRNQLKIVSDVHQQNVSHLGFSLDLEARKDRRQAVGLPLILKKEAVISVVRSALKGVSLLIGNKYKINHPSGWKIVCKLESAPFFKPVSLFPVDRYEPVFKIGEKSRIRVYPTEKIVLTTSKSVPADYMEFDIVGKISGPEFFSKEAENQRLVNLAELKYVLARNAPRYFFGPTPLAYSEHRAI